MVIDIYEFSDIALLKNVHHQDYIDFVEGQFDNISDEQILNDVIYIADTYLCRTSAFTARQCVQACLTGIDKVLQNIWTNGFCSIRPPGHHSGHKSTPSGFCIYNNVAIAAKYAKLKYGITKIVIFDWDVHHCDGTESIFYDDPDTLVISIHRFDSGDFYPQSGYPEKIGGPTALYKNVNVGWNVNEEHPSPGYDEYVYAYERVLGPIVKEFNPQLILISAGYDSAQGDPLGDIQNTPLGYQYLTAKLSETCPKILAILEGGYNITVTAQCALATFKQLLGIRQEFKKDIKPNWCGIEAVTRTFNNHKEFWQCLNSEQLNAYARYYVSLSCEIISGGRLQSFQINGDQIIKKTTIQEILFYLSMTDDNSPFYIENEKLLKFMPRLIEANENNNTITLENLAFGLNFASILDLKIGYKTYNPCNTTSKREKEIKRALKSQQNIIGFRVGGIKIKDKLGFIPTSRNSSLAYKTITNHEQVREAITSVLKSNEADIVNKVAQKDLIIFLQELIEALQTSKR